MRRFFAVCAALALLTAVPLSSVPAHQEQAQASTEQRYERGAVAWDEGRYIEALSDFIDVLGSPNGDDFVEAIALISGELFEAWEVAVDGRNIRISPDGRFAAYEITATGDTWTEFAVLDGSRDVVSLGGTGLVFSPDGSRAAYLAVAESDELTAARQALAAADQSDQQAVRAARQEVQRIRLENTFAVVFPTEDPAMGRTYTSGVTLAGLAFGSDGETLYAAAGAPGVSDKNDIYALDLENGVTFAKTTGGDGFKSNPVLVPGGRHLVYTILPRSPIPSATAVGGARGGARGGRGGGGGGFGGGATARFAVFDLSSGETRTFEGSRPVASADGSMLTFSSTVDGTTSISVLSLADNGDLRVVFESTDRTQELAISPSGDRLVVQSMPREDWELFLVDTSGESDPVRFTHEIQHDLAARFLTDDTILAVLGEGRHRRSYLYGVDTLERRRLFHNNTVRTIAPEYEWQASADGSKVLIVAERDGDTVSPERAVYLVDLDRRVSKSDVVARLESSLDAERTLRAHGERMFGPIAGAVRAAVAEVSMSRLYGYQKSLFDFGSKNITQPGNAPAREYLRDTYESFGYETALQWFETRARGASEPIRTANVLAKLEGTENPELIYVVSSHFDSTARGPGADDTTSGTAMLLETARVLAHRPLPYTVIFASFTGEESGLIGSREFVRQAVESGDKIVGALNNDMMGWSNDHHIDNTIRYSNAGIRDLQHAAAFLFSDLITYDALYYKSTDAAAYYEEYGDIVGGIGSYPVLGNPHYHEVHDVLETINHDQVRETTKTNVASIMLLASSPARLNGLRIVSRDGNEVEVAWDPSPENSVFEYVVRWGPPGGPYEEGVVDMARAWLDVPGGTLVSVKAVSARGLRGWDWAHITIGQ